MFDGLYVDGVVIDDEEIDVFFGDDFLFAAALIAPKRGAGVADDSILVIFCV